MNKKARILASSIAAIALSSSLIAGSTYALFTNESSVNVSVTSGKVKVTAVLGDIKTYSMGEEQQEGKFENGGFASVNENKVSLSNISAGDTAEIPVSVHNESSINVLYRTKVTIGDGVLAEGLEVTVSGDSTSYAGVVSYISEWRELPESENEVVDTVTVALPAIAGSEYSGQEADITITVEAIQANGAQVGTGKYVKTATAAYVSTAADMVSALSEGGNIVLEKDFRTDEAGNEASAIKYGAFNIRKETNIDMNGHTLTGQFYLLGSEKATVTIKNGKINCPIGYYGSEDKCVWVNNDNKTVVLEDVTMTGGYGVYVQKGNAIIKGNTIVDTCASDPYGYKYSLNLNDKLTEGITVYGGTFKNYDPSKSNSEKPMANFVADGYGVVSEVDENGDTWYTVVEKTVVSNATELQAAIEEGGYIALDGNLNLSADLVINNNTVIDLNGHNVNTSKGLVVADGAELSIVGESKDNGTFTSTLGGTVISLGSNATFNASNVSLKATANYATIVAVGVGASNAKINIDNSCLTTTAISYCIGTNAENDNIENVSINVTNTELNAKYTAVLLTVTGDYNFDNCTINSGLHSVIVRAGSATLKDCIVYNVIVAETDGILSGLKNNVVYGETEWSNGNQVPVAAIVIGNRGNANVYPWAASCELINTTVTMTYNGTQYGEVLENRTVYMYGRDEYTATLTYDNDSNINGNIVKGSDEAYNFVVKKVI